MQASSGLTENGSGAREAPLRIGIVGCSLARTRYGAAFPFLPDVKVTTLVDPDMRFIRTWSRTLGGEIALFSDLPSMLSSGPVPEALIIDVPLSHRAETILAAIPACPALLCPTPFAATLEETDRVLHAAEVHGTQIYPAFPRRFDPVLGQAIDLANSGEVGLIQQIRCDWSFPLSRAYGVEIGADPDAGTWGSLLQIAGCHAADVCRWCFGDVLTVSADIDSADVLTTASSRQRDNVPLLAIFLLGQEMGPATCHFARSRAVLPSERYTFTGTQGHLEVVMASSTHPADAYPDLTVHRPGQRPQPVPAPDSVAGEVPASVYRMQALLNSFAQCARTGAMPGSSGSDGRAALEIVHAAYVSARDGRKITLPLRRSPAFSII